MEASLCKEVREGERERYYFQETLLMCLYIRGATLYHSFTKLSC